MQLYVRWSTRATVPCALQQAEFSRRETKARFPGPDGKPFKNSADGLPSAPDGYYTEWTAAASGAKRGTDRVIIGGNPSAPDAVWYWDHSPGKAGYTQLYP